MHALSTGGAQAGGTGESRHRCRPEITTGITTGPGQEQARPARNWRAAESAGADGAALACSVILSAPAHLPGCATLIALFITRPWKLTVNGHAHALRSRARRAIFYASPSCWGSPARTPSHSQGSWVAMHQYRHRSRAARNIVIGIVVLFVVVAVVTAVHFADGSARPAGLIQAGDSKTNCIYSRPGPPLQQAERATGISYNCIESFSGVVPTWPSWVSPQLTHKGYGYKEWLAADPTKRQIILTLAPIPESVASDPAWVSKCAAGNYNRYARQLATNLVRSGFGYSVIRLGAEMNGTWNVGSLGTTVTQWHQWGQCFAQEVQAMRAVPGSHLLFDWNVNANYRDIPLADFYPGNAYVDIIGIDAYDASGISLPPVGNPARWAALAGGAGGSLRGRGLRCCTWKTTQHSRVGHGYHAG